MPSVRRSGKKRNGGSRDTGRRPADGLPPGVDRAEVYRLWKKATRKNTVAQQALHKLLLAHPPVEGLLRAFAQEKADAIRERKRALGIDSKKKSPRGKWDLAAAKAGKYVVVVSGGLPTLGKRR